MNSNSGAKYGKKATIQRSDMDIQVSYRLEKSEWNPSQSELLE